MTSGRAVAVLVAGTVGMLAAASPVLAADGVLDPSFHGTGYRTDQLALAGVYGSFAEQLSSAPVGAPGLFTAPVAAIFAKDSDNITKFTTLRTTGAGELDGGWAGSGVLRHSTVPAGSSIDAVAAVPDGGAIAAGSNDPDGVNRPTLERYTPAGALDPTFGGGTGVVQLSQPGGAAAVGGIGGVAVPPSGKILYAGSEVPTGGTRKATLGRLLADGTPDPTFQSGGYRRDANDPTAGGQSRWEYVVPAPGDKIVAFGQVPDVPPGGEAIVVGRFLADGTPDASFGPGGLRYLQLSPLATSSRLTSAQGLAVQPDGRILLGATVAYDKTGPAVDDTALRMAVVRLADDGTPDPTFGTGGTATIQMGLPNPGELAQSDTRAILLQPDGRIVVGGGAVVGTGPSTQLALARLTAAGALDPTWGAGGLVRTPLPGVTSAQVTGLANGSGGAVAVGGQADDKVLSARYVGNTPPTALLTGPTAAHVGDTVTFSAAASSDPEGWGPLHYGWDLNGDGFPDGGIADAPTLARTFTAPGTYTTHVAVADPYLINGEATITTVVTPALKAVPKVARLRSLPSLVRITGLRAVVRLGCATGSPVACDGSVRLFGKGTLPKLRAAAKAKRRRAPSYGSKSFKLGPGRSLTVNVTLTLAARKALRGHRRLPATLVVTTAGKVSAKKAVTLAKPAPKPKRKTHD